MLINESIWLKERILKLNIKKDDLILNFGSQSDNVYKYQPHILENVIKPTQDLGGKIINYDLFPWRGVDVSGNIFDENVFNKLKNYHFNYIYLFNVLEHVEDKEKMCLRIEDLIATRGIILISVPFSFPTHYDPIDNGFRPKPNEIANLFPNCEIIDSEIVVDYDYLYYLSTNWRGSLKFIARLFTPFYRYERWKNTILPKLKWLNKPYKVTCVILKKNK